MLPEPYRSKGFCGIAAFFLLAAALAWMPQPAEGKSLTEAFIAGVLSKLSPSAGEEAKADTAPPDLAAMPASQKPVSASLPDNFFPAMQGVSIMFSSEDIDNLNSVLMDLALKGAQVEEEAVGQNTQVDDVIQKITEEDKKEIVYPDFQLHSLIYHNSNEWSFRVNGTTYASDRPDEAAEIRQVFVGKDRVELVWHPADPKLYAAVYQKFREKELAEGKVSHAPNRVAMDEADPTFELSTRSLSFTLKTNQTFDTENFTIYEGRPDEAAPAAVSVIDKEKVEDEKAQKGLDAVLNRIDEGNEAIAEGEAPEEVSIGAGDNPKLAVDPADLPIPPETPLAEPSPTVAP